LVYPEASLFGQLSYSEARCGRTLCASTLSLLSVHFLSSYMFHHLDTLDSLPLPFPSL
ncbi:hypothetical protein PM082_021703, partial [Marasmius tenuissimus]